MKAEDLRTLEALPASTTCRRIDFEHAVVVPGIVNDTYILFVSGKKPWASMKVQLMPVVYIVQPDYWLIEVVGCQSGLGLPTVAPYAVELDISNVLGKQGIEVAGANRTERFKVP
jgi:hypothetical protein